MRQLTHEELYILAQVDFDTSVGKVFVTTDLIAFKADKGLPLDDGEKLFHIKDGVRVRVVKPKNLSRFGSNGIFYPNLVDGWLDPYWPVEVLDDRNELKGYSEMYVFPRSFHLCGMIIGTDNLL